MFVSSKRPPGAVTRASPSTTEQPMSDMSNPKRMGMAGGGSAASCVGAAPAFTFMACHRRAFWMGIGLDELIGFRIGGPQ